MSGVQQITRFYVRLSRFRTVWAICQSIKKCFRNNNFLCTQIKQNNTVDFILKMITVGKITNNTINKQWLTLLLQHFENNSQIFVGGLKLLDTQITIATITQKLIRGIPS